MWSVGTLLLSLLILVVVATVLLLPAWVWNNLFSPLSSSCGDPPSLPEPFPARTPQPLHPPPPSLSAPTRPRGTHYCALCHFPPTQPKQAGASRKCVPLPFTTSLSFVSGRSLWIYVTNKWFVEKEKKTGCSNYSSILQIREPRPLQSGWEFQWPL